MQPSLSNPTARPLCTKLASRRLLLAIVLPLLRWLDQPIRVTNPTSGLPFHMRGLSHRGYWCYGKHRKSATLARLKRITKPHDTVFEVGAHIGYLSQFFAMQVGGAGQVHVFEPGSQNQALLRQNIASCHHCVHIDAAVSDRTGKAVFHENDRGGFMNTLEPGCVADQNISIAAHNAAQTRPRKVNTVTLDGYARAHDVWPDVLKIDVEGAEHAVLRGAPAVLQRARCVMIAVSSHAEEIFALLIEAGFELSTPEGAALTQSSPLAVTVFAIRRTSASRLAATDQP